MNSKTIYIVRHGQTDFNRQRIIQGSGVDSSINDTGKLQAQAFFDKYKSVGFDVVLTSALRRTQETMAPFIQSGLPWEQFAEINEIGWGVHEGKKGTPELIEQYKMVIEQWQSGNFHASLEAGESAHQMHSRLSSFIEHLKTRPEQKVLVCSHGRAMRCLMCILKNQHLREMENYHHANTGLYKVNYTNGQFEFELTNDTSHLDEIDLKLPTK